MVIMMLGAGINQCGQQQRRLRQCHFRLPSMHWTFGLERHWSMIYLCIRNPWYSYKGVLHQRMLPFVRYSIASSGLF
jgi:hypothetical protein